MVDWSWSRRIRGWVGCLYLEGLLVVGGRFDEGGILEEALVMSRFVDEGVGREGRQGQGSHLESAGWLGLGMEVDSLPLADRSGVSTRMYSRGTWMSDPGASNNNAEMRLDLCSLLIIQVKHSYGFGAGHVWEYVNREKPSEASL